MVSYQKPENALKRADELVQVQQQGAALLLLHEIILSKRARTTPLQTLEPIVLKFVELSVLLGRGKIAREGLYQYKHIAQQHMSVQTIENVIKRFLELAEAKLTKAQQEAKKINLVAVDDLEAAETPESIMMSTVSSDDSKDRTDREVVTPWLRFLWEAYRTALDTIKNNARLEVLYQSVASQAFNFCVKFQRKTEFRRLCEILRQHLASVGKYANQPHSIDLDAPETLQRHLDTRFVQLNSAAKLEHWQEGFRSVEDIFNLIELSQKTPKAYMMANYYKTLAKILMVGENYLFHAAAFSTFFSIKRQDKSLSQEEHSNMATLVLVSALAIPIINSSANAADSDENKQRYHRLTSLLRAGSVPTREQLLKEALRKSVFSLARPEARELYEILEVRFHPLSICEKIAPLMKKFEATPYLSGYVKPLHQVVLTRLLQQLSQVYSAIKIDAVVKLTAFSAPYNYSAHDIEKFIMNGVKKGDLKIRINHSTSTILFVADKFGTPGLDTLRPSVSFDTMRHQFGDLAHRLESIVELVNPEIRIQKKKKLIESFRLASQKMIQDRKDALFHRQLIEKKEQMRLEELERLEEERMKRLIEEQEKERQRLEEEEKRREEERLELQRKEIEMQEAKKLAEKLVEELREKNVNVDPNELAQLDTNKLLELQQQQVEKEKRELVAKIKQIGKRFDHLERAYRKEEIPLLEKDFDDQRQRDKEAYETKKKATIDAARLKYKEDAAAKKRVARMLQDYEQYKQKLEAARQEKLNQLQQEANEKLEQAKQARIEEHERLERERLEKEEQEQEKKRLEEQRLKDKQEQEEKRRKEQEEDKRKRDEMFAKQQERERLAEEKIQQQSKFAPKPSGSKAWGPSRRQEQPSMQRGTSDGPFSKGPSMERGTSDGPWGQSRTQRPAATGPPKIGEGKWRSRVAEKENNNK
ncbi:hypothetical protein EDD86DRAFT_268152 [Gorgonomyces haynaldii]|nr:hypothetical protein EDD86DRAFT_268152 [Gorgonomyces haynaldii]